MDFLDDGDDPREGPEWFAEAAMYFMRRYPVRGLTAIQVADGLSALAEAGYIISPAHHDRVCADYAARLHHCEVAADELVRQLHEGTS